MLFNSCCLTLTVSLLGFGCFIQPSMDENFRLLLHLVTIKLLGVLNMAWHASDPAVDVCPNLRESLTIFLIIIKFQRWFLHYKLLQMLSIVAFLHSSASRVTCNVHPLNMQFGHNISLKLYQAFNTFMYDFCSSFHPLLHHGADQLDVQFGYCLFFILICSIDYLNRCILNRSKRY